MNGYTDQDYNENAVSVLRCCRLIAVVSFGLTFYMLIKIDFWT